MLDYFKDRSFNKDNCKDLLRTVLFAFGIIAYIVVPLACFIRFNSPVIGAIIALSFPLGILVVAITEICFPKDYDKANERRNSKNA